jgi:hypothetical protein
LTRRPVVLALGSAALAVGLTACHTPGGAVQRDVIVEFETYDSSAAKPVIVAACGNLPGESVDPGRSGDPNLILDVTHTTPNQLSAVTNCLGQLQANQPKLQIRAIELDDGLDN